jgi:hypothetical protein
MGKGRPGAKKPRLSGIAPARLASLAKPLP